MESRMDVRNIMIIGVDAGALSITDARLKVGVWRVTYNLLKELGRIDKTNEYRLYTFLPIERGVMKDFGPRMQNIVVRPMFGWSMIQLPIELRRHPVDVFIGLSQMVPFSTSRNIGFIYDVGFLRFPDAYPGSLRRLEYQTRQLVQRSNHIVVISKVTKKDVMKQYKAASGDITVAYPGVDERFKARGAIHRETDPYILFVGALKRGKNVPLALKIFRMFLDTTKKKYKLLLVGGNYWEDPEIKKTIRALKLDKHVKATGYVSDRELPSYYRGAEALLVTSLWEGFCLPAAEAMACGCPVVYHNTGSLPEIVGMAGTAFETELQAVGGLMHPKRMHTKVAYSWKKFAQQVHQLL